jgi:hypothetical protein
MDQYERTPQGNGAHKPRVAERVGQIGDSAQHLISEARGAVNDLNGMLDLRGRTERNPYAMVAAAAGLGYILGGGLFTPLTARIVRLGIRLAALPFVKDELMTMAENAVDGFVAGSRGGSTPGGGGEGPTGGPGMTGGV